MAIHKSNAIHTSNCTFRINTTNSFTGQNMPSKTSTCPLYTPHIFPDTPLSQSNYSRCVFALLPASSKCIINSCIEKCLPLPAITKHSQHLPCSQYTYQILVESTIILLVPNHAHLRSSCSRRWSPFLYCCPHTLCQRCRSSR